MKTLIIYTTGEYVINSETSSIGLIGKTVEHEVDVTDNTDEQIQALIEQLRNSNYTQ